MYFIAPLIWGLETENAPYPPCQENSQNWRSFVFIQREEFDFISAISLLTAIVRLSDNSTWMWSSTPLILMTGQSRLRQIPQIYAWSSGSFSASIQGLRSLVLKTMCITMSARDYAIWQWASSLCRPFRPQQFVCVTQASRPGLWDIGLSGHDKKRLNFRGAFSARKTSKL